MKDIVYVYNYGNDVFIDVFNNEKIYIKPKTSIPMIWSKARYFVGDGTVEGTIHATFRRGGVATMLQIYEGLEDVPGVNPITIHVAPVAVPEIEVIPETPVTEETVDNFLVSSGRLVGQKWDDVLNPDRFDVKYWTVAVKILKSLPDDRKVQIQSLLDEAKQNGSNGSNS